MKPQSLDDRYSQLFIIAKDSRRRTNFVSILKSMLNIKHIAAAETFEPHHLYPIQRSRWLVVIDRSLSLDEALHEINLIRRSNSAVDILLIKNLPTNGNHQDFEMPDAILTENFTLNDLFTAIQDLQDVRKDSNGEKKDSTLNTQGRKKWRNLLNESLE